MDSFEANKIFGAVLGTVFVVFGGSLLAEGLYHSEVPETPGYAIVAAEGPAAGEGGAAAAAEDPPVATLLASADPEKGASEFKKCASCHSGEEGGPNKVGPHLWDVVNRPIASVGDFAYSAGMKDFSQGGSVNWDYEHLYGFIKAPKQYVSGTAMGYAGLKDPQGRADLIAYLRSLSANPAALPDPAAAPAAPAEGAAAPAEGQAAEAAPAEGAAPPPAAEADAPAAEGAAPAAEAEAPAASAAAPADPAPAAAPADAAPAAAPAEPAAPAAPAAAPAPAAPAPAPAAPAPAPAPQGAAAPAAPADAGTQVAAAGDAKAGATAFRKCQACHAVGPNAANKVGPELNGIVGEGVAAVEGYAFSAALKEYAAANPVWNEANLTEWLTNPKALVKGTKMAFPGIKKPDEIANIIAYLKTFDETGATK